MKPDILNKIAAMGYPVFENGDYDINLIGVRSAERVAGAFDDKIHLCFKINDEWQHHCFAATTDPSEYWLKNGRSIGTAIMVSGHHKGLWALGKHRGKYDALVQVRSCPVYRDNTRDEILDLDSNTIVENSLVGLNLHRAHSSTDFAVESVGRYSAGCQVIQKAQDFNLLMQFCKRQKQIRGWNSFSYTLIED
jgi:hypothetical protein